MTTKLQALINGCQTQAPTPNRRRVYASAQDLRGQSVAVIGLGKSGKSAVKLALERGASVVAIDTNEKLSLLEEEAGYDTRNGSLRTILGRFNGELLDDFDRVVVSPGVPLASYGISSFGDSGNCVVSELDFAAEIIPESVKILAVTGTNGKSTTVTFAGQMLRQLGFETFVGGNLGIPLSEAALQCLAPTSSRNELQIAVVEVSSYQMEIPAKNFCPSVSVVLNLTPDHLDRHGTMENYAMAKSRVFSHMNYSKLAILPSDSKYLNEAISRYKDEVNLAWIGTFPGIKINMEDKIACLEVPTLGINSQLKLDAMKVMGTHNYYNVAVAALAVLGLKTGIDVDDLNSTIGNLRPPLHRMQIVCKDSNGITWVDDSKATNVEATYAGLMGLKGQMSVILLGGRAKVLEGQSNGFEQLVEPLNEHRCVIAFGESRDMIQKTLADSGLKIPCMKAKSMVDAVTQARRMTKHGDAVVLTPACLSFDEFNNFEHRGMVFQELVFS